MFKIIKKTIGIFYIIILALFFAFFYQIQAPANFPKKETYLFVAPNANVKQVAALLEQKNIIKSALLFEYWTRLFHKNIKAGDYLFKSPENMVKVSRRLALGLHGLKPVKITVKEGATRMQIAKQLQKKFLRFNPDKFLLITKDKEGFLYPDTYFFLPNASEEKVAQTMIDNFNKKIKPFMSDIEKSKMTLEEIVNLASLVEREASNYKDRRMIAGVLLNRLKINMPLQVDATWFYTHNKGTYGIKLSELKDKSNPYNTYVHKGLPPSPIGSPSIESIKAVLYPIKHDYLFYLADKNGRTYYSKTYSEHLRKKRIYVDVNK